MARQVGQIICEPGRSCKVSVKTESGIDQGRIYYVGVQGVPSTPFAINTIAGSSYIKIGYTGMYELDLTYQSNNYIHDISVINPENGVIIDYIYEGTIAQEVI